METKIEEIWKDVDGYEGLYQVSNRGRIRRLSSIVNHWRGGIARKKGRLLKLTKEKAGYLTFSLCKGNEKIKAQCHVVTATAFKENPHKYRVVNHIDHDKSNNNDYNLEWTTHAGNTIHAIMCGKISNVPPSKRLDKAKISTIMTLRGIGYNQMDLAKIFKINQSCISRALNGERRYHEIVNGS